MTRRTVPTLGLALLAIAALHGCTMEHQQPSDFALSIQLTDPDTGELIRDATIIAESGEYRTWIVDSVSPGVYWGVHKPGIYNITITKQGYQTKVLDRVIVLPDRDGVRGEDVRQFELEKDG